MIEPDSGKDIVALGMVSGLVIKDGNVGFAIEVPIRRKGAQLEPLRKAGGGRRCTGLPKACSP